MRNGPSLDPKEIVAENERTFERERRRDGANYLGDQMIRHRKPNKGGGPCDVCGCPNLRLGAKHRAFAFGERRGFPDAVYEKVTSERTGDSVVMELRADGTDAGRKARAT